MSIPRFPFHPSAFRFGLALSILLAMASVAQAQKQASCTFTLFPLNLPNSQHGGVNLSPEGTLSVF